MKRLLEKRFRKFFVITGMALFLLAAAYFLNKYVAYDSSAGKYTALLQKALWQKEADAQKLMEDTALMNRLASRNYTEQELRSLLESKKNYAFFLYTYRQNAWVPLFWNAQSVVPGNHITEGEWTTRPVFLKNGYYIQVGRKIQASNKEIIVEALIPVLHRYFVEVENLQTSFEGLPDAIDHIAVSEVPTDHPIYNRKGEPLFYLSWIRAEQRVTFWWILVIALLGFILLFRQVHLFAEWMRINRNGTQSILFLSLSLMAIRFFIYFDPGLLRLRQFELFDPGIYSYNILFNSLGDLAINAFFFAWLLFFINKTYQNRSLRIGKSVAWSGVVVGAILLLLIAITFGFAAIIKSLVADAHISFNVTNFFSLNSYSFFGFAILVLLTYSYFLVAQIAVKTVVANAVFNSFVLFVLTASLGLLLLTFLSYGASIELELYVLGWLILFIAMLRYRYQAGYFFQLNLSGLIFWLFWFSFSIAVLIVSQNSRIEKEQRVLFAERLSLQADPANERLLSIALAYMDNDFLEPNFDRFLDAEENSRLKDEIISKNFSAYLNKFETRIYTFDAVAAPLYNEDPVSFDTLNTIYNVQGKLTGIADLKYFEQSFDKYSYIFRKEVRSSGSDTLLGYFFVMAEPRRYKNDALVPALFRQQKQSLLPEFSNDYSYAVYGNGELIDHFNDYEFPTHLKNVDLPRSEYETRFREGYEELWYRKTRGNVVIIARKSNKVQEAITLFAYLFTTFLLLLALNWLAGILIRSRTGRKDLIRQAQVSIRTQVHSVIILVSLFSFIIIGATTILFFIDRYNRNNQERLSRTMQIMVNQVQGKLNADGSSWMGYSLNDPGLNDHLEKLLQETSEVHGTDVNLYDPSGRLRITTRPVIYGKGVLSDLMNPEAWYIMHQQEAIQCIKKETMGKLEYLSIYNPIRNSMGDVIAFLNVPSYNSQAELKQEISNFLVTLINLNAFIFLVAGAIALFITNRITSSFSLIVDKMRAINLGKVNQAIEWNRNDEIGELIQEYNKMVQKLDESAATLARTEREGAWRQMARQVAHEIKNPLTPMKLSIQYLQKAIDGNASNVKELTQQVATTLVEQIDHLSKIAADFSQFANISNAHNEWVDLHEIILSLASLYGNSAQVDFHWLPVEEKVQVYADKTQLNRLFTNLIQNAIEAASARSYCRVRIVEELMGDKLRVSINDNGEGIPESMQEMIFTPNFTTKSSGTGLGLAMSKGIMEQAGGEIGFLSEPGKGATFFVIFPSVRKGGKEA